MSPATITTARAIAARYGTSYYRATLFLPGALRDAVFVLYAFARLPDEMVDNPLPGSDPAVRLHEWKNDWILAYDTKESHHPILAATSELFHHYHIPLSVSLEFIDAMIMDLEKTRYHNYEELRTYMRGSAQAVGVMLTYIFGFKSDEAFFYAAALGEAMQLTNFLRDVREDYDERGRIYLPQDECARFGVTEAMIAEHAPTPQFITLMQHEVARARTLYRTAELGIELLSPQSRRAVRLAARFYEAILDEIEHARYDVFSERVRVPAWRKGSMILRSYVSS